MGRQRSFLPWVVWIVGMLAYAVAVINRSSLAALGPAAQVHFGADATQLSIFVFVQLAVYASCQIPVGVMMTKFGTTRVVLAGLVLMTVGQFAMAIVPEVWLAVIARLCLGAGDACVFICVIRLAANWFKPKFLPIVSQVTGLAGQAGQLISVTPLALLVDATSWSSGFFGLTGVTVLVLLLSIVTLRNTPGDRSLFEQLFRFTGRATRNATPLAAETLSNAVLLPVTEALPVTGPAGTGVFRALKTLLKRPGVRLAFWVHFTTPFTIHSFLLLWGTPFLTGGMRLSAHQSGLVLSVVIGSSMIGGLVLGPLTSRWAHRRLQVVLTVVLAIVAAWTVTLVWPGQAPLWWLIIMGIVIGAGGPASMIAFDVVRTHTHERQLSVGTGLANTGGFIAAITLVLAIGIVLDVLGAGDPESYSTGAFKIAMLCQYPLWGLGIAMILRERPRARDALVRRRK
jgi:MFS family permease